MPSGSELYSALQGYHPSVDLSNSGLLNDANTAAANGMDANTFVQHYAADPRITQAYSQKYATYYQPTIQGYNTQEATIGNQQKMTGAQYAQGTGAANQQYDYSRSNIQANQYGQNDALMNAADASGITRGGNTLQGVQNIAQDTTRGLTYNETQRANTLAQLALQKAQQDTSLQGALAQVEAQKAQTNQQIGLDATQAATQDTSEAFNKRLALYQAGAQLPVGRSVDVAPGYQVNGTGIFPDQAISLFQNVNPMLLNSSPTYRSLITQALGQYGFKLNPEDLANITGSVPTQAHGSGGSPSTPRATPQTNQSPTAGGSNGLGSLPPPKPDSSSTGPAYGPPAPLMKSTPSFTIRPSTFIGNPANASAVDSHLSLAPSPWGNVPGSPAGGFGVVGNFLYNLIHGKKS